MNVKRTALSSLHRAGVFALARQVRTRTLVVVTYHGVLGGDDDSDHFLLGNFVAASAFEWQMAWIARRYTPIPLSDVVRSVDTGRPLPPRAAVVTFDDGFANNFRYAFPILRRHAIPATIFLTTGHIGARGAQLWTERVKRAVYLSSLDRLPIIVPGQREWTLSGPSLRADAARDVLDRLKRMAPDLRDPYVDEVERVCGRPPLTAGDSDRNDFLAWDDVRAMAAEGIEFGSHTVSHPILTTLDDDDLARELQDSRRMLEGELQRGCVTFAYPNGKATDFGDREKRVLAASGYRVACSLLGGLNGSVVEDPFGVDRINVTRGFYPALFDASLTGALRWGKEVLARRTRPARHV